MGTPAHTVDVTYICDDRYLYPTLISAFSLLEQRPRDITLRLFLTEDPSPASKARIDALQAAFPEAGIEMRPLHMPSGVMTQGHVSPATYARLSLPELLTGPTLYLDGDTLVRGDVAPLFDADPERRPAAAVPDAGMIRARHGATGLSRKPGRQMAELDRLGDLVDRDSYVNAGVLFLDLPRMRELGLDTIFGDLDAATRQQRDHGLRYNDQNWVNHVFKGQLRLLDPVWNALWGNRFSAGSKFPPQLRAAYAASRRDPMINHFTGKLCPWDIRFPLFYPKRRPWLAEYKAAQARADAALALTAPPAVAGSATG